MACRRHLGQLGAPSVIAAPKVAVPDVVHDLPPNGLGFPRDHRIHPLHDLVYAGGRVNAAHDHGDAETSEVSGHFVGAVCLRGEGGDAHQVRTRHARIVRRAEVLIDDRDLPRRRGQPREDHEVERFPHAVAVPAVLLDPDHTHEWVGRVDQTQSHGVLALITRNVPLALSATGWPLRSQRDDTGLRTSALSRLAGLGPVFARDARGSAAATPWPTAQALRTLRPRLVPLGGVAVAALAQVSKQVPAARECLPAGGAAKRDRGAEVRFAALVMNQAHVVAEVPLRPEDRAADLAVEGLGGGECRHVASSSRLFDRVAFYSPRQGIRHPAGSQRVTSPPSLRLEARSAAAVPSRPSPSANRLSMRISVPPSMLISNSSMSLAIRYRPRPRRRRSSGSRSGSH